ncbi:hypothetical protein, partial [Lactobacillus delbrueckii]|uniref:hypothetical protein n=1 Tax=Lactobacillus delbrueckii TaxID=1584 RepID=UPI0021A8BFBF
LTPNLTAFTGVDSQNLPDVMVSVQFILAIGGLKKIARILTLKRQILAPRKFIIQKPMQLFIKMEKSLM